MKKVLTINTKYRLSGGEDTNIVDELLFLKKELVEVQHHQENQELLVNLLLLLLILLEQVETSELLPLSPVLWDQKQKSLL